MSVNNGREEIRFLCSRLADAVPMDSSFLICWAWRTCAKVQGKHHAVKVRSPVPRSPQRPKIIILPWRHARLWVVRTSSGEQLGSQVARDWHQQPISAPTCTLQRPIRSQYWTLTCVLYKLSGAGWESGERDSHCVIRCGWKMNILFHICLIMRSVIAGACWPGCLQPVTAPCCLFIHLIGESVIWTHQSIVP